MTTRLLLVAALLACAGPASAQTCTVATGAGNLTGQCDINGTLQIVVQRTVRVTLSPGNAVLLPPLSTDYDQGYQQALGQLVQAKANGAWQVMISSSQTDFTAAGGARPNKPRSDLSWSTTPLGPYQVMSGVPALLGSGAATAATALPIYYRVAWAWAVDRPGTYSLPITITITSP